MADDTRPAEKRLPDPSKPVDQLILGPAQGEAFSAVTAPLDKSTEMPGPSPAGAVENQTAQQGFYRSSLHLRAEFHSGPIPDPATLHSLADVYPNAPKIIFEEFRAQSSHRCKMENAIILANIEAQRRGQWFGLTLGVIGLICSTILVSLGHDWAGVAIATGCLGGLVSVFVLGRGAQSKERLKKEALRGKIQKGDPIEGLEGGQPNRPSATSSGGPQ